MCRNSKESESKQVACGAVKVMSPCIDLNRKATTTNCSEQNQEAASGQLGCLRFLRKVGPVPHAWMLASIGQEDCHGPEDNLG